MMFDVDKVSKLILALGDTSFACPYCGEFEYGCDSETAQLVVSYWGDEPHEFSCDSCGNDYFVHETVRRSFAVSIDGEEPDNG